MTQRVLFLAFLLAVALGGAVYWSLSTAVPALDDSASNLPASPWFNLPKSSEYVQEQAANTRRFLEGSEIYYHLPADQRAAVVLLATAQVVMALPPDQNAFAEPLTLLARSPYAREVFRDLLRLGTPAGKVYGICGLYGQSPADFHALSAAGFPSIDSPVWVAFGPWSSREVPTDNVKHLLESGRVCGRLLGHPAR